MDNTRTVKQSFTPISPFILPLTSRRVPWILYNPLYGLFSTLSPSCPPMYPPDELSQNFPILSKGTSSSKQNWTYYSSLIGILVSPFSRTLFPLFSKNLLSSHSSNSQDLQPDTPSIITLYLTPRFVLLSITFRKNRLVQFLKLEIGVPSPLDKVTTFVKNNNNFLENNIFKFFYLDKINK